MRGNNCVAVHISAGGPMRGTLLAAKGWQLRQRMVGVSQECICDIVQCRNEGTFSQTALGGDVRS